LRDTDWEEDLIQEEVEPEPPAFKDEQEKAANDWIRELYGDKLGDIDSDSPKITLEQINADEQILRHLEEEPAYMRL
jgi:hypothetical protein